MMLELLTEIKVNVMCKAFCGNGNHKVKFLTKTFTFVTELVRLL